ncbi:MAG: hypothetical protein WEB59_05575 [Thermoanaerobaculia bacterium]
MKRRLWKCLSCGKRASTVESIVSADYPKSYLPDDRPEQREEERPAVRDIATPPERKLPHLI